MQKSIIKYILLVFLTTRLFLTLAGTLSKNLYTQHNNLNTYNWKFSNISWLNIWGVWDSGYYLDIAKRGYSYNQNFEFPVKIEDNEFGKHQLNFHFFPLYPLIIKALTLIIGSYYYSGIIISNISLLFACYFLYQLLRLDFDKRISKRSVLYLLLFPSGFIYSGVFTESTTLLFIILSFYLARLNKPIWAGFFSAFGLLTKSSGALSVIALVPKNIKKYSINLLLFSFAIPVFAFILFLTYHHIFSDNAFIYFQTASRGWGVKIVNPIQVLATLVIASPHPAFNVYKYTTLLFSFTQILMICIFYRKLPLNYWFFWLISFLLPMSSGVAAAISIPRHVLLSFPQFLAFALISENKNRHVVMSALFFVLQIIFMTLWVNGYAII